MSDPSRSSHSACLTDELVTELMDGRLASEELIRAHRHAAECSDCHALLFTVGRLAEEDGGTLRPGGLGRFPTPVPVAELPASGWKPPDEFDEFRLLRVLGRGSMGVVYLAHDRSPLDRQVAVKFIAAHRAHERARERFRTEASAMARLQHPNIVTVFRVGEVEGHPYIVSEYVTGQSLDQLDWPQPWRRVLNLGIGLARGLAAAHRQGVLHRDLKPSNVLLTPEGEVKLLDFGLAELVDAGANSERTRAGTPLYMAPELFRGSAATPQSDLYALGLMLCQLCTGELRRPPAGKLSDAVVEPEFAAVIQRCLSPDPLARFESADALCDALDRIRRLNEPAPLAAGNPYRGLAPFEAEHQKVFFGRDTDIQAVLERLRRYPVVLVAGDSGVGKSSVCRAGVLPRVSAGALDEARAVSTVTLWPGRYPLQSLAAALAPILGQAEEELVTALSERPAWLGQALRDANRSARGLLLFIDQLEELITLADPTQAARFAALLGELALPSAGVRVLLAVRGDFLTRVLARPGIGDEAERALYILRPLSPEGAREAIVGPARTRGVAFESDELIRTLVASAAHGEGSLPLLQFALAELWERRNPAHGRITRAALEEMGGVAGALSRHADQVLARLTPAERQAARRILLHLVTGEGTRIERRGEELAADTDDVSRVALRALVDGRLVHARTGDGRARYEIAHDSLIESWGTLRNWRDDEIGHRAVRERIEVASAEWERLAHAREALWGQKQLDETLALDAQAVGPREQAFLLASRRALLRRRWNRRIAVLLVALALASVYGGIRLQEQLKDTRFVTTQLDSAKQAFAECHRLGEQATQDREGALFLFDGLAPPSNSGSSNDPNNLWKSAERRWARALAELDQADAACARAGQSIDKALDRSRSHRDARRLLTEVTYERLLLAERFHQQRLRDELMRRLEPMLDNADNAALRERLSAPAELELVTEPPGASVEIARYVSDAQGRLRRESVPGLGSLGLTPSSPLRLPAGSYHLHITHPDRVPVDLPLLLTRESHEQVRLTLPTAVPTGYVYIPPGCFLLGSDDPEPIRKFLRAVPLHRFCINEGYLIGRTEVTFGDWIEYLNELPPGAPAKHILDHPPISITGAGSITLRRGSAAWIFAFYRSPEDVFSAREGEPFRYPDRRQRRIADWLRFPLSGVSAEDLAGYFYWLSHSGRLPGARLCNEHEWERAARGADGRAYPHGDQLAADDANIDETYDRQSRSYGPDVVGSHPFSTSPFGLHDMSGNAFEMTRPATAELGRIVLRGGSWYYDSLAARVTDRTAGDPTQRDAVIGARVCASFNPP